MMFQLNKRYNFSCHASSILGSTYRNVKVVAIVDYKTALKDREVNSVQRQVYPVLPQGTPVNHKEYTYVIFELENSKKVLLAYPWIMEDSILLVQSVDINVKVYNTTDSDVGLIRDQLRRMGYVIDITYIPTT